jgi:TatD DNase family protein
MKTLEKPEIEHPLIDIAVNLTDKAFEQDLEDVIHASRQAGVHTLIVTGTTLEESVAALELCNAYPEQLYCTAGLHPHYAKTFNADTLKDLASLYTEKKVCAAGETGLDFNRNLSPPNLQELAFEKQIELACEHRMPLLMHERDAHQRFHEIISDYRDHIDHAVLHCFTGSKQELYRYLDLDLHIGVTGWICDERRGQHLLPLLKDIPSDRMMLETDAPYLLPRSLSPKPKGRRNEPRYLPHICSLVAKQLGVASSVIAERTTKTARDFFDIED